MKQRPERQLNHVVQLRSTSIDEAGLSVLTETGTRSR